MRYRAAILLVFLAACCAPPQSVPIVELISVWELESGIGFGTGFPISCEPRAGGGWTVTFLTAKHLLHSSRTAPYKALHQDGRTLDKGLELSRHPSLDAATVAFSTARWLRPLPLCYDDLEAGDRVYSAGYQGAESLGIWITAGLASARDRTSAKAYPGGSGSPILDRHGRVRGVAVRLGIGRNRWTGLPEFIMHHNTCVPLSDLREWLER